jgi:drug/metabolite transporter (DMT)-like permease
MSGTRATTPAPSGWRFVLPFALLCAIWSSTWLVIKDGLGSLPVFSGAAFRFSLAALVFTLIAPAIARREGGGRPSAALSLAMGLLNFGISYGIVYWGEQVLPSGLASVLWATFPLMVALLGHFTLPDERLQAKQWLGFIIAFAGIVLLFVEDLGALGGDAKFVGGVFLLSPLSAAVGQVVIKRYASDTSSALLNRNGMWIGAATLWLVALPQEDPSSIVWTARGVASVVYLALFGTVTTFGLYYWLLRRASANRMSLIAYITPVAAVFFGASFGGEALTATLAAGAGLVLAGLGLTRAGSS